MTVANDAERWLSVSEIAAYLGIKVDTAYKWIRRRGMPAHKAGRLWKFKRGEVDEWVRSGEAGDPPDNSPFGPHQDGKSVRKRPTDDG